MVPIISVSDLSFSYGNGAVFHKLNLELFELEFTAILGKYGQGKTTLLHLLTGAIELQHGEIKIGKYVRSVKSQSNLPHLIGYLFENPEDQIFMPKVSSDVLFGLENLGFSRRESLHRLQVKANLLNISHLLERSISSLSFGEKKLVALLGILVIDPKIIILDHPFTGLDFWTQKQLIGILGQLKKNTTLICTSNSWELLKMVERFLVLDKGEIIMDTKNIDEIKNLIEKGDD